MHANLILLFTRNMPVSIATDLLEKLTRKRWWRGDEDAVQLQLSYAAGRNADWRTASLPACVLNTQVFIIRLNNCTLRCPMKGKKRTYVSGEFIALFRTWKPSRCSATSERISKFVRMKGVIFSWKNGIIRSDRGLSKQWVYVKDY